MLEYAMNSVYDRKKIYKEEEERKEKENKKSEPVILKI